ncbi:protein NYNRIN-like [Amborella trichopoda]|uniref:protein NYNRIN-like n=1 Tax=Amborella trichopoda TaxID=13333 RepID=UPI0005D2D5D3|nr:protein NYNRIN-like [Amborella trichopoda]|eukprot:XP_011624541.1 protein NYNRIN-like [Amborella trichopoda]
MDIVGPIDPPSSLGHKSILAATDYFSNWAEAVRLRKVPDTAVADFIHHHIIYRFGVSDRIIFDNGPLFRSSQINRLAEKFGFTWKYWTMYHPRANGLAKAFNGA